jgi:hypothetical protein
MVFPALGGATIRPLPFADRRHQVDQPAGQILAVRLQVIHLIRVNRRQFIEVSP